MKNAMEQMILVTGATGYVGGRLVAALERGGRRVRVRCLARRPWVLAGRVAPETEVVEGDCLDPASLAAALKDVHTAYYLVHSMGAGDDFSALDRRAAGHFGQAAREAGVRRIIYLGGLGAGEDLSAHLRSRQETGEILRASGVPVVEFRASIIIGSGSLSFEMVRALAERIPVMICPRWVSVATQPIAVEDVLSYLLAALELPEGTSETYEIGGPDVVSYGDLILEYARQRGLWRVLIPVPVLTPTLSSLWLGLVTPLYARIGRKLIDSLRNATVVGTGAAQRAFPHTPRSVRDAVARAINLEDAEQAATRWSDALSSAGAPPPKWGGRRFGARIVESHARVVAAAPAEAFAPIRRIGGREGWYSGRLLWQLRGLLDLLAGGVGMRRGRRDPESLRPGDALDCWRVEAYEPDRLLRLAGEMRVPGRAWLQFEVTPLAGGRCEVRQTAIFDPAGLAGRLYWHALYPVHAVVFRGMLAGLVSRIPRPAALSGRGAGRGTDRPGAGDPDMTCPRPAPRAGISETTGRRGVHMRTMHMVAAVLLIVGGLNWGLVGFARFDLVAFITGAGPFGAMNALGALVYGLVGLAALYHAVRLPAMYSGEVRERASLRRAA
jgi:uncharacterized protein YbjT (DUF2867 family)/uncharacterized membrane protein YuzA (DUF378 family)